MKYYLENYPKNDFYLIGEIKSDGLFHRSHGYNFIKEYLNEYPYLSLELIIGMYTDWGIVGELTLIDFLKKIKTKNQYDCNRTHRKRN